MAHPTPIDDSYPSCVRTNASLLVYTKSSSPDVVTERLGHQPTSIHYKGQRIRNSYGRERQTNTNLWALSSHGRVESMDLRRHINWVTSQVLPVARELKALLAEADMRALISCNWWSRTGLGGPLLSPDQMRAIADLELECGLDVMFMEGDDAL